MSKRIVVFFFSLLAALVCSTSAQTDTWLEVRTPRFVIVSNSSEKEARHVARQFEGMHSVFQRVFPDAEIDGGEPILVFAVQDKQTLQALEPEAYLGKGQVNLVGLFLATPEKNYVLISLNAPGVRPYAPVYHEYAHFVFSLRPQWMPLWLSEGLAEFYQNSEILDDKVRLGKGDPYVQSVLEHNALLPLPMLFAVDQHSPYYHEKDKGSMFYAESWALTHFLKDKDALEGGHRLTDYVDLLQTMVDSVAAATQVFGDLNQLQLDLKKYVMSADYAISEISGSTDVDDPSFTVQALTQVQADDLRAEFLAHDGRESDARALLQGVLREDPLSVEARETMGYLALRDQKFDRARKWCQEAIELDAQSFVAHYYFALASIREGTLDKAARASVENSLRTVIKLKPSFQPAYDALAIFYADQGINLAEAHELIETAVQLAPGVAEVRVDEAQVLEAMNRNKEAVDVLEIALKLAHTPEQTAAVENVLQSLNKFEAARAKMGGKEIVILPRGGTSGDKGTGQQSSAGETPARAVYAPGAEYTEKAKEAGVEGVCVVTLIVGTDGKPSNIVVTKKLGMGLDEKAVEAISKWRFEPGRRYGTPVVTHLTLKLEFKLFGGNTQKFFDLSEKAKSGDADAELELANAFFAGRDIAKDVNQGMALLERAARSGLPQAQFQMGERTYGDGNNAENYVTAYLWYALAQRGSVSQADAKVSELEARMTSEQLSEAQKRLENWLATPPK
jgi:TonB family protein